MFLNISSGFFVCALFSTINRSVESLPHNLKDTNSLMSADEDLLNDVNAILDPLSVLNAEEKVEKLNLDDEEGSDDSSSDCRIRRITKRLLDLEQPDECIKHKIRRKLLKKLLFRSIRKRRSRVVYDDDEDSSSGKGKESCSNVRDIDEGSSDSAKSATSATPANETQIPKTDLTQKSEPKVDQSSFQKNTSPADQGIRQPLQESTPQDTNAPQPISVINSNSYRFNHHDTNNVPVGVKPGLSQPILSSAVELADQQVISPQTETLQGGNQADIATIITIDNQAEVLKPKINRTRYVNPTATSENELIAPMPLKISPADGIVAQNEKELLKTGSDNKLNNADSIQITNDDSEKTNKNSNQSSKDISSANNNEANKIEDNLAVLHQRYGSKRFLGRSQNEYRRIPRRDIRRVMRTAARRSRFERGYYGGRFGGRRRGRMGLVSSAHSYNQQPVAYNPNIAAQPDTLVPAVPQQPDVAAPAVPQQPDIAVPAVPQQPDVAAPAAPQIPESPALADPQTPETPAPADPEKSSESNPNSQQPESPESPGPSNPQQLSPADGIVAQNEKELLKTGSDNKLNNADSIQITNDDSEKTNKNSDQSSKDISSANNNEANKIEDNLAVLHQRYDSRRFLGRSQNRYRRIPRRDIRRVMRTAARRSRFERGYYGGRFGGRRRGRMGLVSSAHSYNQQPVAYNPNIAAQPDTLVPAVPQQPDVAAPAVPQQPDVAAPAEPQQPDVAAPAAPQQPETPAPEDPEQPSNPISDTQGPGQEDSISIGKHSEINQIDSNPSQEFSGEGTHYDPGVGLGSCGKLHQQTEMVAAMNALQYGNEPNPNNAAICNKCILVSTKDPNGLEKSVKVQIQDKCPPCKYGDVDLSTEAFKKIAPLETGRIKITWKFVPC
ncbi:Papain inhibitor [Smittium culicis]|uniref:Papain inhibitor n=1 Tax=Smittium culicis TaxID=133412 RepID=A0A1R1X1N1_9FUNG|nr:Papain inhibitor [Smittium culicis]